MNEKIIISEIAKLIAFDKKQLISEFEKIGYRIKNKSDLSLINFITDNIDNDIRIANIIANMIIENNQTSNVVGAIFQGIGGIVGGITGVFSEKEKVKNAKEGTKQAEILLEAERLKLEQEKVKAASKLGKGTIIAIAGAGILIVSLIIILATRRKNVVIQPQA
jgi:DNA-binding transcriptional MerR regulator